MCTTLADIERYATLYRSVIAGDPERDLEWQNGLNIRSPLPLSDLSVLFALDPGRVLSFTASFDPLLTIWYASLHIC